MLWVLKEMGRNGKDLAAALDRLRVGDCDGTEPRLEKNYKCKGVMGTSRGLAKRG